MLEFQLSCTRLYCLILYCGPLSVTIFPVIPCRANDSFATSITSQTCILGNILGNIGELSETDNSCLQ